MYIKGLKIYLLRCIDSSVNTTHNQTLLKELCMFLYIFFKNLYIKNNFCEKLFKLVSNLMIFKFFEISKQTCIDKMMKNAKHLFINNYLNKASTTMNNYLNKMTKL